MSVLVILCLIDIFFLSTSTTRVTACGVFEFHSPQGINNTFILKENTAVNITFTLLNLNCSKKSFGSIDISRKSFTANQFGRQCVLYDSCKGGPYYNNRSCQCLDKHGLYSFTFIATRHDSAIWKWSTAKNVSKDAFIQIIVTYPPLVISLETAGNDRYIPRHKNVSIFCSWVNGYPPSEVRLLDRHRNVLASGVNSGNISYTFHSVDCNNTGTIRCEANGSYRNESLIMLVACPPEILIPLPRILIISTETNTNVTFPFRSHDTLIDNCHITRMNRKKNMEFISAEGSPSFTCTNQSTHFTLERNFCFYSVSGIPPDLQLTLQLYNVNKEDVGLWRVNVSNNKGSDILYIQVDNNNDGNNLSKSGNVRTDQVYTGNENETVIVLRPTEIVGSVIGIITFTVIALIIARCVKNGKDSYSKLRKREMNEKSVYRGLCAQFNNIVDQPQEECEIYNEIGDPHEQKDLHSSPEHTPVELCLSHFADSSHLIHWQTKNSDNSNTGNIRRVKPKIITSSEILRYSKILKENSQSYNYNHLQAIQRVNDTCNEPVMPNELKHIHTGKEEENISAMPIDLNHTEELKEESNELPIHTDLQHNKTQPEASNESEMPTDLKHNETQPEASNESEMPTDLKHKETQSEASNESEMPTDLKHNETLQDSRNEPEMPNDLKHIQTGSEICHVAELSDDLKRIETGNALCSVSRDLECVNSIQTSNDNVIRQDTSNYLTLISTFNETRDVAVNSDYLEPTQRR